MLFLLSLFLLLWTIGKLPVYVRDRATGAAAQTRISELERVLDKINV